MGKTGRRNFIKKSFYMGGMLITGTLFSEKKSFSEENNRFNLNVGYLPIADHLILPVSHAMDNSNYNHVNIRPYLCKSWDEITKKIDMGILHAAFLLAPLAMSRVNNGSPLKCILFGHKNGSVIAANNSIRDFNGLTGKTVGIPHSKSTHSVLLYKYLKSRGIKNISDVKLVNVPPPLTVKNLKAKRIDAYSVAEPWGVEGLMDGSAHILEYSKNIIPDHPCCLLMVKNRVIENRPESLSEWVKSLKNAGDFIHRNPDTAGKIQEQYMNHKPEIISSLVKDEIISYRKLAPEKKALKTIHDFSLESGVLKEKCDFDDFLSMQFV